MKIIKNFTAYFLLTLGYIALVVVINTQIVDIIAAIILMIAAFKIGKPNFTGSAIALFSSTLAFKYFVLFKVVESQNVTDPLNFIFSNINLPNFATDSLHFIAGLTTYGICVKLSNHEMKADEK